MRLLSSLSMSFYCFLLFFFKLLQFCLCVCLSREFHFPVSLLVHDFSICFFLSACNSFCFLSKWLSFYLLYFSLSIYHSFFLSRIQVVSFFICFCSGRKYFFLIKLKGFSLKSKKKKMFDPCHAYCHQLKTIYLTNGKCCLNTLKD